MVQLAVQVWPLRLTPTYLSWLQSFQRRKAYVKFPLDVEAFAVYFAAFWGLPHIVRELLRLGTQLDYWSDGTRGNPPIGGVVSGKEKIVSMLLETGADPDIGGMVTSAC